MTRFEPIALEDEDTDRPEVEGHGVKSNKDTVTADAGNESTGETASPTEEL